VTRQTDASGVRSRPCRSASTRLARDAGRRGWFAIADRRQRCGTLVNEAAFRGPAQTVLASSVRLRPQRWPARGARWSVLRGAARSTPPGGRQLSTDHGAPRHALPTAVPTPRSGRRHNRNPRRRPVRLVSVDPSGGIPARTIACPVPSAARSRLRGVLGRVTLLRLCEPFVEGGWRDAGVLAGQEYVAGRLRAQQR
jgi:hypothetical protein